MTDQTSQPLTEEQLDGYEALARNATLLGADIASPNILSVLVAEVRQLRAELAGCRSAALNEAADEAQGAVGLFEDSDEGAAAAGALEGVAIRFRRMAAARVAGEQPAAEALIGSITIRSESVQLDNGECLRDLAVGESVELRAETGHEGLWIASAFHGDFQDRITLQHAEVVEDCGSDPALACKFNGTRHAHPVDLDGKVRPRPTP